MSTLKKHSIAILAVVVVSIGLIGLLAWTTKTPYEDSGNFNRTFIAQDLKLINVIDKPRFVIEMFGGTQDSVYFQCTSADSIVTADVQLKNLTLQYIPVPTNDRINSVFYPFLDANGYTVLAGRRPGVLKAGYDGQITSDSFPGSTFTRATRIAPDTYVFRIFEKQENAVNQVFIIGNLRTRQIVREQNVSEKSNDAGISTDGRLLYDKKTNRIIYAPYGRTTFWCMDTTLRLVNSMKAVSYSPDAYEGKAGDISNKDDKVHTFTNTAPRALAHPYATVQDGVLYALSGIRANNQSTAEFNRQATIDKYDIASGKYLGSFTIPAQKDQKVRKFRIVGKHLVAMYGNYIATYSLPA